MNVVVVFVVCPSKAKIEKRKLKLLSFNVVSVQVNLSQALSNISNSESVFDCEKLKTLSGRAEISAMFT